MSRHSPRHFQCCGNCYVRAYSQRSLYSLQLREEYSMTEGWHQIVVGLRPTPARSIPLTLHSCARPGNSDPTHTALPILHHDSPRVYQQLRPAHLRPSRRHRYPLPPPCKHSRLSDVHPTFTPTTRAHRNTPPRPHPNALLPQHSRTFHPNHPSPTRLPPTLHPSSTLSLLTTIGNSHSLPINNSLPRSIPRPYANSSLLTRLRTPPPNTPP